MSLARAALIALLVLSAAPLAAPAQAQSCERNDVKIIDGAPADARDWPGMVALRVSSTTSQTHSYSCGGAVIAERWVLTAAHCAAAAAFGAGEQEFYNPDYELERGRLEAVIGVANLRMASPRAVYGVSRIVLHPAFLDRLRQERPETLGFEAFGKAVGRTVAAVGADIALLELDRPWTGPIMRRAIASSADPEPERLVRLAGWGLTEHTEYDPLKRWDHHDAFGARFSAGSERLLQTDILSIDTDACRSAYQGYGFLIGDGQICSGIRPGADVGAQSGGRRGSCHGDSGGPLVVTDDQGCAYQVGLVSGSAGCGMPGKFIVFTRVSAFGKWIDDTIRGTGRSGENVARRENADTVLAREVAAAAEHLRRGFADASEAVTIALSSTGGAPEAVVTSGIPGRLSVISFAPNGAVQVLYPSRAAGDGGRIAAGGSVALAAPGNGATLVAVTAPIDADLSTWDEIAGPALQNAAPVERPVGLLFRMVDRFESDLAAKGADRAAQWAMKSLTLE